MDNSTVKESWIDKLVDELIDAKDQVNSLMIDRSQLDALVDIIFNGSRLNYDGNGLRIDDESEILAYLRAICPETYKARLRELKAARDEERALIEAVNAEARAEVAATEEA